MNVLALIETGAQQLTQAGVAFGHGTTNAFDEAAWLVLWKLGLPLDDLDGVADQPVRSVGDENTEDVQAGIVVRQRILQASQRSEVSD